MNQTEEKDFSPKDASQWISLAIRGAFVGVGGILPGVSGGVLCVAFGIYKPLMEVLANPFVGLKKHFQMFVPFIIGGGLGFLALAGLIGSLLESNSNLIVSGFIGLILGVFPALFREAGQEGRDRNSWIALAFTTIILTFFLFLGESQASTITPTGGWYFFSGVMFGIGVIVPGMSSSSLLMFLGLYQPMVAGIGALDFAVLIPVGLGVLASVVTMARAVQRLFAKHYSVTFHGIVGFVIASTLAIVPRSFESTEELVLCVGTGLVCCGLAYGMDEWGKKIKPIDSGSETATEISDGTDTTE